MSMRESLVIAGAIAALASSASAGVTVLSYQQQVGGSLRDLSTGYWPAFGASDSNVGQTTLNQSRTSADFHPLDQANADNWGNAVATFTGDLTSTVSGTTYTASGSTGFGFTD